MLRKRSCNFDLTEDSDSKHRENVNQNHDQTSYIYKCRDCVDETIKDDVEPFRLLEQSENSTHPQYSKHRELL